MARVKYAAVFIYGENEVRDSPFYAASRECFALGGGGREWFANVKWFGLTHGEEL